MLPPGHVAAGFLTAKALLQITKPAFDQHQINQLLLWGAFFGFAPDLDMFWAFAKSRSWVSDLNKANHRKFVSHAPILWAIAGLLIYFFGQTEFVKFFGLIVWLASWSHFVLDSIEYGVMWLWPFSEKVYALKNAGEVRYVIREQNFFKHWWNFLQTYVTRITFYFESLIILTALAVYFR